MATGHHEQLKAFLKKVAALSDTELDTIASAFYPKTCRRSDVLLASGDVCTEFYFIARGGVRVFFITSKGQEKTRHIALENTIITSLSSFVTRQPSSENIDALEETELLAISQTDFYHFVDTCRAWELFYRMVLETAYIEKVKHIESRVTLTAKQRFADAMREHPHFLQRVSNRILASYLDITQETLSRLKSDKD